MMRRLKLYQLNEQRRYRESQYSIEITLGELTLEMGEIHCIFKYCMRLVMKG